MWERLELIDEEPQQNAKKGELRGLDNEMRVCILKWRDKGDVLLLISVHTSEML